MARHASSVRSLPHFFAMGEVCSVCYCREWALAGGPLRPDITETDQVPPRPHDAQTTPPLSDGKDRNGSGKCRTKTPRPPKPKTPGPPKPPPLPPGEVHSRSRSRSRRGNNRDDDSGNGSRQPTPPLEPPGEEPCRQVLETMYLSFAEWNMMLNRKQKAAKAASRTATADNTDVTTNPSTVPGFAVSEAGRASSSSTRSRAVPMLTVILLEFKRSPKGFRDIILTSPRLAPVRESMEENGRPVIFGDGVKVLVWGSTVHAVLHGVCELGLDLKARHVLVSAYWERKLLHAIRDWPGSGTNGGRSADGIRIRSRLELQLPAPPWERGDTWDSDSD
jgi:hypothetical protein